MKRLKIAAALALLATGLFSFEAKAEIARILLRPAELGVHETRDEADQTVTNRSIGCHRPARVARNFEARPVVDVGPESAAAGALVVAPRRIYAPAFFRAVARPGFVRRPDAERAPPV